MNVAKRYCKALCDTLRHGNGSGGSMDKYRKELGDMVASIDSDTRLRAALYGPIASKRDKAAILAAMANVVKVSPIVFNFLALLARKGRVEFLPAVYSCFDEVLLEAEGGVVGEVVSAEPLDEREVEKLSQSFERRLGRKVKLHAAVDPELLAGVRVRVSGVTYDGSLRAQFGRLKDVFMGESGKVH